MKINTFSEQLNNTLNTSINGIFQIPDEEEIGSYMMNYEPFSGKIDLKQLIKMPNFYIVRDSKQLYFGEVVENKKHGFGVNITKK